MKSIIIISFALLTSIISYGQYSETRDVGQFTTLDVGGRFNVELIPSNQTKVEISDSNVDTEYIYTKLKNNTLNIGFDYKAKLKRNKKATIKVYYTSLEEISASASTDITSDDPVRSDNLDISVSSGAEIELEVAVNDLEIDISSGGDIVLSGKCVDQDIDISSGGSYKATDLKSQHSQVDVSSGGSAKINTSQSVQAHASSGGFIGYLGDPDKVKVSSSSGGRIKDL